MRRIRRSSVLFFLTVTGACGGREATGNSSSGSSPSAGSGSGATGSTGAAVSTGATVVSASGIPGAPPMEPKPSRCAFGPTATPQLTTVAAPAVVQARIERFILGDAKTPLSPSPAQVTPGWAGDIATRLLDGFGGASSGSPGGFVRWLAKWTYDGKAPMSAPRWANVMAESSATLASLIAAPNPDNAHGVGYMTDRELLAGRSTIDRRGMMILDQLICMLVPPPPPGFLPAAPMAGTTDREFHAQAVSPSPCSACHTLLDPFGHAFEHFDRSGNYRDLDNGLPVDASDAFVRGSWSFKFSSIDDLALQLAESCEVARCISRSLLREAIVPDLPANADAPLTDDDVTPIAKAFADSGFSMRTLVRSIVESPAFLR